MVLADSMFCGKAGGKVPSKNAYSKFKVLSPLAICKSA